MDDKKFVVEDLDNKDFTHKDALVAFSMWDVTYTNRGGSTSNDVTVHIYPNGSMNISDDSDDGFISLTEEQMVTIVSKWRDMMGEGY